MSMAAVGGGAMVVPAHGKLLRARPDTIILAKKIYTLNPANDVVEAIALSGDRILALGTHQEIRDLADSNARVIDARDSYVFPGFMDAHSHPMMGDEANSENVNLTSIAEIKQALARRAKRIKPGHWLEGHAYDDTRLTDGRPLLASDLDEVSTEIPILVMHRGGHTGIVNSRAFQMAGITADTPNPEGGTFFKKDGKLTGLVAELALVAFSKVGQWTVPSRGDHQKTAELNTKRMAAAGLTSVTDAGAEPFKLTAYLDALHAGTLNTRLSVMPWGGQRFDEPDSLYSILKQAGIRSGDGSNLLNIGAVKFAADGSASERTMRMSTHYEGRPDDFGILRMTQEQIDAAVDDAVANRFRVGIHANGDVTIDMVLKAYERVLKGWKGPNPRMRLEHCSLVNPDLLRRIKASGCIPTPFYTYAYYHGEKWKDYGAEKMQWMFAHKSFLDYGIPVAPASDYLPGPYEPMMALQSMVTRKDAKGRIWGPNQRITIQQALRICTVNGAYSSFEEDVKGTLEPGKLADLVMLDRDPHTQDPDRMQEIRVQRTIMGGRITHEA
jgi:predicted amidohydrolase YtcJ